MKFFQGVFIALVFVLGGGYFYYTGTPEYAVKQLAIAIEDNDKGLAQDYADLDALKLAATEEYLALLDENTDEETKHNLRLKVDQFLGFAFEGFFMRGGAAGRFAIPERKIKVMDIEKTACTDSACAMKVSYLDKINKSQGSVDIALAKRKDGWKVVVIKGIGPEIKKYIKW